MEGVDALELGAWLPAGPGLRVLPSPQDSSSEAPSAACPRSPGLYGPWGAAPKEGQTKDPVWASVG